MNCHDYFTKQRLPDNRALTILLPMMTTAGSAYTKNRQLKAILLLVIACCVMLICLTQRASILHQMQVKAAEISLATQNSGHEATTPSLSPCELSAHSLLAAQPLHVDTIILLPGLLVILLAVLVTVNVRVLPDAIPRPPLLRIHLKNCVFRE
ncbi:copper-binding protein [Cronobacter sakazakii]|uniref:copper-binding protein n=1 Tax=Cronobacter sakazakii TaxID=28141 RepID=UPI0011E4B4E9|nr:copper-binding protein [Cronobacter sakazakii]MDT3611748.1 copper-binding protein [Cronobacter sakazakii]QWR83030.1 copper-binding protein [Cronobacter sakazakii]TYD48946.1 copper-binding protein [Cronobacter sakazakii]